MNTDGPVVTLHLVMSVDGFIARKDNSVSWLESAGDVYEQGVAEEEVGDSGGAIDCFVLGSRTYEHALEIGWPYGDVPTVVLTSRELARARESVEFYLGGERELVERVLVPRYRRIWVVGGAAVARSFLRLGLVDAMRLTVAPVVLGGGLRLFGDSGEESRWRLTAVTGYRNGFVGLGYGRG